MYRSELNSEINNISGTWQDISSSAIGSDKTTITIPDYGMYMIVGAFSVTALTFSIIVNISDNNNFIISALGVNSSAYDTIVQSALYTVSNKVCSLSQCMFRRFSGGDGQSSSVWLGKVLRYIN